MRIPAVAVTMPARRSRIQTETWNPASFESTPTAPKCHRCFENWSDANQATVYAPVA